MGGLCKSLEAWCLIVNPYSLVLQGLLLGGEKSDKIKISKEEFKSFSIAGVLLEISFLLRCSFESAKFSSIFMCEMGLAHLFCFS